MSANRLGHILLCLLLILGGAASVLNLTFNGMDQVLGFMAIAAGVLLLWRE